MANALFGRNKGIYPDFGISELASGLVTGNQKPTNQKTDPYAIAQQAPAETYSNAYNNLYQNTQQQTVTSPTGNSVRPAGNSVRGTNSVKAGKSTKSTSAQDIQKQRALAAQKAYKEQQQAIGQQKNLSLQQIDNLMALLDPTFAKTEQDYRTTMDKNRNDDLNALMAQAMSRGIGDSEFAVQAQERARTNYDNELSKFLSNLSMQKQQQMTDFQNKKLDVEKQSFQDASQAKSSLSSLLDGLQNQQYQNQLSLENQAASQARKLGTGMTGKQNFTQRAMELKQSGKNWGEIADTLWSEGFNLMPGSEESKVLDYLMTGKTPSVSSAEGFDTTGMSEAEINFVRNILGQ